MAETIAIIKRVLDTVRSNGNIDMISVKNDYGARFIEAVIAVDGKPIHVDQGAFVTIEAKRADMQSDAFSGAVNENGTVKVPITQWMLEIPNTSVEATVVVHSAKTKLSTTNFYIKVQNAPHGSEEISPDDPNYDILIQVLAGESGRVAAENTRQRNEEVRQNSENYRNQNEEARVGGENARMINEDERIANERARVAKDSERDEKIAEGLKKAEEHANIAKEYADDATAKAAEASAAAGDAAGSASAAQVYANDALRYSSNAQTSANNAKADADRAEAAADKTEAALATVSNEVNPRAMFRQLAWYDKTKKKHIYFEDVFASNATSSGWSYTVYALEAHGTASTTQDVYVSRDGGETWDVLTSLAIDATNGVWYTDIFVDNNRSGNDTLYLLKTNSGFLNNNYQLHTLPWNGQSFYTSGILELGARRWLGNCNSIDVGVNSTWTERAVIFGEYHTTTDGTTYSLWKTKNNGKDWYKVLEIQGNKDGATGTGDIRHWHTVQFDNYTKHWWATSGDAGNQCRIYRSTDNGETWEIIFSGSQRERTCGFVFEKDCIYYAMDSTRADRETDTKIFKIDKSKLDTDRDNCREEVATVDSGYAVYGLSRTEYPRGFIVWSQFEPGASVTKDRYILQFYDYGTKKLYPIARIGTSDIEKNQYIGFYAGSRMQNIYSGVVFAKPTYSLQNGLLGNGNISTHVKVNITC